MKNLKNVTTKSIKYVWTSMAMFKNNQQLTSLSEEKPQIIWEERWHAEKLKGFCFFFPILGIIRNSTSYPTAEGKLIAGIHLLSREALLTIPDLNRFRKQMPVLGELPQSSPGREKKMGKRNRGSDSGFLRQSSVNKRKSLGDPKLQLHTPGKTKSYPFGFPN